MTPERFVFFMNLTGHLVAMRWQLLIASLAISAAWAVLAAWQYHDYGHECRQAEQSLQNQAEALTSALVGGIRSHRRLGRFLEVQLQGVLDELVAAEDILSVAVTTESGKMILSAGPDALLDLEPNMARGGTLEPEGFHYVALFTLASPAADLPGRGSGGGWGGGRGRGWGRGFRDPAEGEGDETASPLSSGGRFKTALLLDRTRFDAQCARAARLRAGIVLAGGLMFFCIALVWLTTLRMIAARGRSTMLEAEARHLRELSRAAAGLAHETRNPLGLIRGWMQRLAQSQPQSPEVQDQAHAVIEECDRVTSRINQFLAFAKPCEPRLDAVDLPDLVGELGVLLEPDLETKQLRLEPHMPEMGCLVRADGEMLRQALFNLLQNAIQFSPEGETVAVSARHGQNGSWRVEVADRGPGVAEEQVGSLFSPYFSTRANGTGLGLAIVRQIALAHRWRLGYTPREGGGAVFWLEDIEG